MSRRLLLPREWGVLRYSELWLDGDELLYVQSSRFSDRYARYRLRDIQALVVTEFPIWNLWRATWLGLSFSFTMVLLLTPQGYGKLFAILPGIVLAWAIGHVMRGPRCLVMMHTAVSTVRLEPISTMARAQAAMPVLRQLIEGTQGRLAPDGLTVMEMPQVEAPPPAKQNTPLLLHVLFGMMVAHALLLAGFYFSNKMSDALGVSATLLFSELILAGLVALRWRAVGPALTLVAGLILVLALADGGVLTYSFVESVGGFFSAVGRREAVRPEDIRWLWLKEQTVGRAAWHAVAGLAGWVLYLSMREKEA